MPRATGNRMPLCRRCSRLYLDARRARNTRSADPPTRSPRWSSCSVCLCVCAFKRLLPLKGRGREKKGDGTHCLFYTADWCGCAIFRHEKKNYHFFTALSTGNYVRKNKWPSLLLTLLFTRKKNSILLTSFRRGIDCWKQAFVWDQSIS